MFEIRRNITTFGFLLLLALIGVAASSPRPSAAKPYHSQASASIHNSNQANSFVQNTNDVQIIITSYQSGMVFQQTVNAASSANVSENPSRVSAPAQTTAAGDIVFSQI